MIYINGRFLDKPISGVPLYGREILKRLDTVENKDKIAVLIPKGLKTDLKINNLQVIEVGRFHDNLWEQVSLTRFMRKHKHDELLNLCNSSPMFIRSYITIHDIGLIYNKGFKSLHFTLWYKFIFRITIKRAKKVFTVSEFCRDDIARYYKIDKSKIIVTYNGCEHILDVPFDDSIVNKYELKNKKYYLFVGSNLPHKNLPLLIDCARRYPNELFVVVTDRDLEDNPNNVLVIKNINFSQMKSLYANAYCFMLLSSFEGFGIPPLEAALSGCKRILLSNLSVFKELYCDIANYIDITKPINLPNDSNVITDDQINDLKSKYSWYKVTNTVIKSIGLFK